MGACLSGGQHFEPPTPGHEPVLSSVTPRTHGNCEVQVGRGKRQLRCVVLRDGVLHLSEPCSAPAPDAEPHKAEAGVTVPVVGSKLRAHGKDEFVVTGAKDLRASFRCPAGLLEREAWMLAFQKQPGIFRHIEDYFEIGRVVGQGATSRVYECRSRFTGKVYGIKRRVHKDHESSLSMHNELALLQQFLRHPHPAVPTLADYFFDSDGHIALVVELMTGGELFERIMAEHRFTEAEARGVVAKIAAGIDYLHHQGVAHRDLKPQNIMFVDGTRDSAIKIMDYDLAKVSHASRWTATTPCGTTGYMAPEIIDVGNRYGLAVDMWSLGCIIYILLCGKLPFGHDEDTTDELTKRGVFSFPEELWAGVSEEAKDLVRRLLVVDASQRLTAEEVVGHPWLARPAHEGDKDLPDLPRDELRKSLREINEGLAGSIKQIRAAAESTGAVALLEPVKALASGRASAPVHASSMRLDPTHYPDADGKGGPSGPSGTPGAPARTQTLGLGGFFRRLRSGNPGRRGSGPLSSGARAQPGRQDSWVDVSREEAGGQPSPSTPPPGGSAADWGLSSPNGRAGGSMSGGNRGMGMLRNGSADDIADMHVSPTRI